MTLNTGVSIAALAAFAVFLCNVVAGAFWNVRLLSDVGEMLMLLLSCLFFVMLIVNLEKQERGKTRQHENHN